MLIHQSLLTLDANEVDRPVPISNVFK